ncbi:dTDP-glucose 4,6-dehydratase [Bacillus sp. ISL-47]|uniref:dTDP-glucose 4,6-dehydratase n=1 Tax=Bacillus sp. ISL-47 TaxID=2819130 RepID=UPI001BE4E76E|nr:dTDP-glucose 4,6-dehydratase [Bacillus sp. ISL-47]MBT2686896.1 dTDP-glucose 4,6-dehydratase [Bacillus sp. ISL-47]MBT2710435.1 dTDP-glucose 4,6-dehydratase [Pseudomonas sp. ISL-84]
MKRHLLVTGGAGFIGSNFISYLLENSSYLITNVDSLTYAANDRNTEVFNKSGRYRSMKIDIGNKKELEAAFDQEYEAIINFAAESHVDRSIDDATLFLHTNILGTFNLLEAVRSGKAKKMIQISTDEVYGSLESSEPPFSEDTPLSPNNPYSASKASADLLVRSFFRTHQLPLIITRCSNNYGPRQHEEKFIPKTIKNLMLNKKVPLYGDGMNIRDWIYVTDHCHAVYLVLEKGVPGEIYNIGGHEEKTNLEVVNTILNKMNKNETLIKFVMDRKGHDRRYGMNSAKITRELGWIPQVTFEDGIQRTIDWYKSIL